MKRGTEGRFSSTVHLLLTMLWLVMQVTVPAYHHHAESCHACHFEQGYWQNDPHDEHECHICSLYYSPSSPDVLVIGVVIPEDTCAPCLRDALLNALKVVNNPSVRAPPMA